ncbi:molybdate transport system permease protein [Halobacillus karajensis]|uniref:Molybdenum transport system permease n=1 Tax=Halobacillus karajensis TaxID=195088 RepID=A0A059NVX9_9BACI|nr:molybdate ABC transporter permease subunit [Halobacillus karajensis]CDQ18374.1 Molybdenum transport system permease protein ModB [Halobacillus karajensis]CDQ23554.1 Molybdenum transport system permease protein ModB [Halobacillus karajensis]CDQ27036.1 Molybdenum transport system permease protein ModB [Halobacillus karajensis]SEH52337.1 molybdate transport system permease protein [Halobacillus karajensis]
MNMEPLWLSLKVAGIATIIVFIIGLCSARIISRKLFPGKSIIESILLLPLVLPPTVIGFSLLYLFGKNGWFGQWLMDWLGVQIIFSWWGAVIASTVVSFPLMYQSASAAFQNYDRNLEHAALTLGATKLKVFFTISLPLAWPGLLAGLVMSFARSLGEFGATLMIAGYIPGKTDTIPLAIYFSVESGRMEEALMWVITILALGFSTVLWMNTWSRKKINFIRRA